MNQNIVKQEQRRSRPKSLGKALSFRLLTDGGYCFGKPNSKAITGFYMAGLRSNRAVVFVEKTQLKKVFPEAREIIDRIPAQGLTFYINSEIEEA